MKISQVPINVSRTNFIYSSINITSLEEMNVMSKIESIVSSTLEPNFASFNGFVVHQDECDTELEGGGIFIKLGKKLIQARYQIQLNFAGCLPQNGALFNLHTFNK